MTRFAKVPEEVLDIVPNNLAYHYARLSAAREYDSGEVRAASWSELAALMKCSERGARRVVPRLIACGVLKGDFPSWVLPHCVGTSGGTSAGTSVKRTYSPEYQNNHSRGLRVLPLWADFIEGRSGKRPDKTPPAPKAFTEAVRAVEVDPETLSRVCRLAGESYSDWDGVPNFANAMDRGLAALSAQPTERKFNAAAWKAGGTGWE